MRIRLATPEDVLLAPELERRAGAKFSDVGMEDIAAGEPTSAAEYSAIQEDGLLWVACDDADRPAGFIAAKILDGCTYIHEVSVDPDFAGQKLGRRLIDTLCDWAKQRGYPLVTLSTFRDVPWNAPYYAKMGFEIVEMDALGPNHAAVRADEIDGGLDGTARVFMRRIP